MSWKTELAKSVSKIDKATGKTETKIGILVDDFQRHRAAGCPETSHIKIQNGKLDKLNEKFDRIEARFIRYLIGAILFICSVIGGVSAWKGIHG